MKGGPHDHQHGEYDENNTLSGSEEEISIREIQEDITGKQRECGEDTHDPECDEKTGYESIELLRSINLNISRYLSHVIRLFTISFLANQMSHECRKYGE